MIRLPNFSIILTTALVATNAASVSAVVAAAPGSGPSWILKCAMDVAKPHGSGKLHGTIKLHGSCGDNSPAEGGGGTLPDVTCTAATDDGGSNCNADGPPAPSDPDGPDPTAAPPYLGPTPKASATSSTGVGIRPGFIGPVGPGIKLPHCAEIHATNVHYCSTLVSAMQKFCAEQIPKMDLGCARASS